MSFQQQQQRKAQEYHYKDPSLNYVEAGSTSSTTTTSTTSSTTTTWEPITTTAPINYDDIPRRPYPVKPSTQKAATAYSLFSNGFDIDSIYTKTHYLSSTLSGKIWWDVNGDAKRGDYGNATLNEMEYDYGIPNVGNILLVSCDGTEEKSGSTTSQPYNGRDATPLKQSLDKTSGTYDFQQLNNIPSGRYYVMYEAPLGWRIGGNTLPLGRREGMKDGEVYYECVPEGGEGKSFEERATESGDFDYGGYCGRSIGCLEVGTQAELMGKFEDLELLDETEYYQTVIQGDTVAPVQSVMGGKMVALPQAYAMDVGMFQQEWPLPAKQFADAMVTLRFPISSSGSEEEDLLETLLSSVFSDAKSFGSSTNRNAVTKSLQTHLADQFVAMGSGGVPNSRAQEFASARIHTRKDSSVTDITEAQEFTSVGSTATMKKEVTAAALSGDITEAQEFSKKKSAAAIFALDGIDLYDAKIERKKKKHHKDAIDQIGRYLRASRRGQENEDEVIEITYKFTTQGTYNPPPHEQLGYFVANSINANTAGLVRSLREDKSLPFQNIQSVESDHLTIGPPPPKVCDGCIGLQAITAVDEGGLKPWATVPVVLLSLMIGALMFVFLGRRLWKRRVYLDVDEMCEMHTSEFKSCSMTDEDIAREKVEHCLSKDDHVDSVDGSRLGKDKKKKKKTRLKDRSHASSKTGSLRSLDFTDDESKGSLRKSRSGKKNLDKSDNSSSNESSAAGSLDEIEASLAKVSKKHSKKELDGGSSSRSDTSDKSGSTNRTQDEVKNEGETEEERRRRCKKEKKAKKKAERFQPE